MSEYTILIVEDNMPINRLFNKHLTAQGYTCFGVTTIQDGIAFLQHTVPDLLILDFELPDGYAIGILEHILRHNLNIPTLIISASTRVLELSHYPQYKIEQMLVKPVSPRYLSEVVKNLLCLPMVASF